MLALALLALSPQTLKVGPGQTYATIEAAVATAHPGDTIEVYPEPSGYPRTAVQITTANIKVIGKSDSPVLIKGDGFDYSGVGKVPRAIFQIDPEADGVSIRNFELTGAHNGSYNGAGVRINGANGATIDHCDIHGNDMGIMSAPTKNKFTAGGQTIEECHIHHNGATGDPGYNHNLYLDGWCGYLNHCEVDHSLTGHNLKSRFYYIEVHDCYFHDSANREADLVEDHLYGGGHSDANFFNCVFEKDPSCSGNRGVIHFGAEHGDRRGVLRLVACTVVTPFSSPAILLSTLGAGTELDYSIFSGSARGSQKLVNAKAGPSVVTGKSNWFGQGFDVQNAGLRLDSTLKGDMPGDFHVPPPKQSPAETLRHAVGTITFSDPIEPSAGRAGWALWYGARWTPLKLRP